MSNANKWPIVRLLTLAPSTKGAITGGPFGSDLVSRDYVDAGIPVVRGTNLPKHAKFSFDDLVFVTENKADALHLNCAHPGDLVFTQRGTLGQVGLLPKDSPYSRFLISQSQMKMTVDDKQADSLYLYYYFRLPSTVAYIENHALQSGVPHINLGILRKLQVICPPLNVQKKIAAIISAYDDLIENNQRRIALLEKMAEELYREWFVRMRFPGHEQVKKVKGVPEGWGLVKLEQAFSYTGGGTPSKEVERYWNDGDVNWFTPSDITGSGGIFLEKSGDQCTEEGFNNSSAKMFPAYSIMLTSRATIGAVGINLTPACTNQGFITCIPNEQYPLPYLYHWIKLAKPYFEQLAVGATFAELTKGTFKRIEILTPPEPIVNEFSKITLPLFKAIESHLRANKKLTDMRDLMLPRLISGKLSVEQLDIQFPPSMEGAPSPQPSPAGRGGYSEVTP